MPPLVLPLVLLVACSLPAGSEEWTVERVRKGLSPHDAAFSVQQVGLFIVASDVPEAEARTFAEELVPVLESVSLDLMHGAAERALAVYFLATTDSYRDFVTRHTGAAPWSDAGFFTRARWEMFVNREIGAYGTACHEMVHALIAEDWGERSCPLWLNEGVASIYEWPILEAGGRYVGSPTHRIESLRDLGPIPLETLFRASGASATQDDFAGPEVARFQATARLLCVFLDERGSLARVYQGIRDAERPDLPTILPMPVEDLEREFRTWIQSGLDANKR